MPLASAGSQPEERGANVVAARGRGSERGIKFIERSDHRVGVIGSMNSTSF